MGNTSGEVGDENKAGPMASFCIWPIQLPRRNSAPIESASDLLTVKELASLPRIATSVYRLVEKRLLPFHRLPRGLRFNRKDVESYLNNCRVESVE